MVFCDAWLAVVSHDPCICIKRFVHMSTKESSQHGNSKVDAASDRLGEVAVGAKLLAEANKDEGLDQLVDVAFHGGPSLARESCVLKCRPFRSCRQAGRLHLFG